MIISGGFNIYPNEIEDLLNNHEEIIESAVVGRHDADLGEVPIAVIVSKTEWKDQLIDEIKNILSQNLAQYKIPREIKFIEELTRNAMGKIQKKEIISFLN